MIRRETDADLANAISRLDGVITNVSYDGRDIDWAPAVEACVILSNGIDAIQVYEPKEPRIWEVMTIFGPECRGKRALETAFAMREWMLPHLDIAFGSVPNRLRAAKWFYRKLGGLPVVKLETALCLYEANEGETLFVFRA